MASKPLNISWNNNSGGLSDNKYQGLAGRFSDAHNVSTRGFYCNANPSSPLLNTYTGTIGAIYNTYKANGINNNIVWLTAGQIYRDTTLISTLTAGQSGTAIESLGLIIGGHYLYYISSTSTISATPIAIHRTDINGANLIQSHKTYIQDTGLAGVNFKTISFNDGSRILFSANNKLYQLDGAESVTEIFKVPAIEGIVGITRFQNNYKIYTSNGVSSNMYTWDGNTNIPSSITQLPGLNIKSGDVVNQGAYDYFVSNNSLYLMAGVQHKRLYNNTVTKVLLSYNDFVYCIAKEANSNIASIATYGELPGYPKSLTLDYTIDINNTGSTIDLLTQGSTNLYYTIGSSLYTLASGGSSTSYLTSLVLYGSSIKYEKLIDSLDIKFSNTSATNTVKVECMIQEDGNWLHLWTGHNGSIGGTNHGITLYKNMFLTPLGTFNTIKFKITFLSTTTTPTVQWYGLDIFAKQDIGK